jgi:hypothetical protein
MYLYVLDEDETGSVYVLFPLDGYEERNPIRPGAKHRLPGRLEGRRRDWAVTADGGREDIVVIGTREAWSDLEAQLARLPHADGKTRPPTMTDEKRYADPDPVRRGIGGAVPAPAAPDRAPQTIDTLLRAAKLGTATPSDVWIWRTWLRGAEAPSP